MERVEKLSRFAGHVLCKEQTLQRSMCHVCDFSAMSELCVFEPWHDMLPCFRTLQLFWEDLCGGVLGCQPPRDEDCGPKVGVRK